MNTSAIDRDLLKQVRNRLNLVEEMISRLRFFVREVQADGGWTIDKRQPNERSNERSTTPSDSATLPVPASNGSRRRSDLLRRATLSLLESARKGARV